MKKLKIEVVVTEDGKVVLEGLPVKKGDKVEVTIAPAVEKVRPTYPLRGLPVGYVDPFLPAVDENEWNALK